MKKSTKAWLIAAGCLILIGAILFTVTMAKSQWDFRAMLLVENETKEFEIVEDFDDITILATTEDITIEPSGDGKCKVVFNVPSNFKVKAVVEDGTLAVSTLDSSDIISQIKNYDFGVTDKKSVAIYLPAHRYGNVGISEATGDIAIDGLRMSRLGISVTTGKVHMRSSQCGSVSANTTTGDMEFEGVTCDELSSKGSTGDITLRRVIAAGKIAIERGTGDVALDGCDAGELEIRTSTGNVTGTLLSDKQFVVKSGTGDIEVPENTGTQGKSADGADDGAADDGRGTCTVTTGTGDIVFEEYTE